MKKFLQFSFLPASADLALFVLRVCLGGLMFLLHGWGKLTRFSTMFDSFPDPLGIGHRVSYVLATGGETVGALLVVLGLFARLGALWAGAVMGVAFFAAHGARLTGQGNGEMALLFLVGFLTILIAGAGRYSFDARMGAR